jgi:hypothetical protein
LPVDARGNSRLSTFWEIAMRIQLFLAAVVGAFSLVAGQSLAEETTGPYGAWDLTLQTQEGSRPSWVKLFRDGDAVVAEFVGATGGKNTAKDVRVAGKTFQWANGNATYQANQVGDTLAGIRTRDDRSTPFIGKRVVRDLDVTGNWDVTIEIGDRTLKRELQLEQAGGEIAGHYSGDDLDELKLEKIALRHHNLTYAIEFATDGGQRFTADYDVTLSGDRLAGLLSVRDTEFEGSVKASRRRQWGEPIELFNGRDLSNWEYQQNSSENQWHAVDKVMVNQKAGWNILTKQKFKDYKLRVDVKVPSHGNSGIYVNGRYEVQVEDGYGKEASEGSIGAIYGRAVPTSNPSRPAGEWQTFEITFVDYWATVTLNGTTIVDNVLIEGITGGALDSNESEPGPIMLQGDHGPIEYRNVVLTPLVR